jgi:hypothetical protein
MQVFLPKNKCIVWWILRSYLSYPNQTSYNRSGIKYITPPIEFVWQNGSVSEVLTKLLIRLKHSSGTGNLVIIRQCCDYYACMKLNGWCLIFLDQLLNDSATKIRLGNFYAVSVIVLTLAHCVYSKKADWMEGWIIITKQHMVQASIRRDGSSVLVPQLKLSASLAWRIGENFMQNQNLFNDLACLVYGVVHRRPQQPVSLWLAWYIL